MPVALRHGPYTFYFYAGDGSEPPHIHVRREDAMLKYWLTPIRLASNKGFRANEVKKIERIVVANQKKLQESWNEYFND